MSPDVAILLATYNGSRYIKQQIESISLQSDVKPLLFISDDNSSDNTLELVQHYCKLYDLDFFIIDRHIGPWSNFAGSANNFFHLISSVKLPSSIRWVAFSDQDDVWESDHLSRAVSRLNCDPLSAGYSSCVVAFWPNGKRNFLKKHGYISRFNHLFESPGPGCSIVIRVDFFHTINRALQEKVALASSIQYHDWLIFAFARSLNWSWIIDEKSSLFYRQHDSNVLGANFGIISYFRRLCLVFGSWYRQQCLLVARFCCQTNVYPIILLERLTVVDRIRLMLLAFSLRRRFLHRIVLSLSFLFVPR